jgi:hypothetical protein
VLSTATPETSRIGSYFSCRSVNAFTRSTSCAFSMIAGRYWLFMPQFFCTNMGWMIRRLFFTGKRLVREGSYSDSTTVSAALSVKMSILLYLPGLLVILFKRRGLATTLRLTATIVATQALLAFTFLHEDYWAYLRSSFDLSRVFLYKWTVNWRFVDEETFLSPRWANLLLAGHISVLILFGLFTWCKADGGVWRVLSRGIQRPRLPAGLAPLSADCELSRSCPHDFVLNLRQMWLPSSLRLT